MKKNILICTALAVLMSCQPEDKPTPACPKKPVTAEFTIGQGPLGIDTLFYGDTVLTFRGVVFEALEGYDYYEWKIGEDPTRQAVQERTTSLFFEEPFSSVAIRLIVHGTPNLECFPKDDGKDTLIRYINVVDKIDAIVLEPFRYEGYLEENPNHTFVIAIQRDPLVGSRFVNLNEGCTPPPGMLVFSSFSSTYRRLYFKGGGDERIGCNLLEGWATLAPNNIDIEINYTEEYLDNDSIFQRRFIGQRIQ